MRISGGVANRYEIADDPAAIQVRGTVEVGFEDISPPGFMTIKVGLPKSLSTFEIRCLMEDMQSLINRRGISATVTTYHNYFPKKQVSVRDGLPKIVQPKRGTFKAMDEKLDSRIGNPSWKPKISQAMPYGKSFSQYRLRLGGNDWQAG